MRNGLAEQLLLGVVDTAMMAQNALTAAESLGLGGVFIGGLRNNIEPVTELLKLPQHVLPLFGLCLGWPADNPDIAAPASVACCARKPVSAARYRRFVAV